MSMIPKDSMPGQGPALSTLAGLRLAVERETGTVPDSGASKADLAATLEAHRLARFRADLGRAREAQARGRS